MYGCAGLPNPPVPEHPRVEIVSTKHFLHNATQNSACKDIAWVGILQSNTDTSDHGATERVACGLAAHAILKSAENADGNMAEDATCGTMYHFAHEVAIFSV